MKNKVQGKNTPPKSENLKLKQKSEAVSDVTHVSQRSYQFNTAPTVKHLNLEVFKINPCNITKNHNHKHCINYHSAKDRRRYGNFYAAEMCNYIKQDQKCPDGQNCLYAHSFVEEHYSYQKYKKYFCFHYPYSVNECPYGDFCSYAHSEEQILSTLIHNYAQDEDFYMFYYKTEFCPFNLTKHEPSKCVYAHNWQDYRRRPDQYCYEPIPCYNWKTKDYISISDYHSGCEIGVNCNMCHGWKEQQYHPSYYKTIKCEIEGCRKGSCPNYHSQKEKRIIDTDIINRAFRYVPKNRIVQGVFKSTVYKKGFELNLQAKNEIKSPQSVIQPKILAPEENQFKSRTLVAVKQKRRSREKEENQWIKEKKIIDSEQESSDAEDDKIIAEQITESQAIKNEGMDTLDLTKICIQFIYMIVGIDIALSWSLYLRTKQQLNDMLNNGKVIIVIFVDPNEFMPAKLLLNYIYSHGATSKIDTMIFIWNQVDQQIYDKYNVVAFPQITVLKGQQVLYSALGYNREKANEAIELLCKEAGLGKLTKQINKGLTHCPNGHELSILDTNRQQIYVGGCFECNRCNRLCHFEKTRPTLHCEYCSYDICPVCSYSDVLI